ncbi:MAG: excinuclease ABC subunit UvrA, partial [Pirellulales bacterium]
MNRNAHCAIAAPAIRIRGARMHNLRQLDVDLPRNRFVVVTGPSGSGKSSLAFDTLYAEGQRQYIESLSVYARQFLHQMERPEVELIEGLQPTISIDQRAGSHNPRSTVATVTEIYDYLRLLYARLGEPTCHRCGRPIRQQSPEQILDALVALPEGTRLIVMAPMVRGRRGEHRDVFEAIRRSGLVRVRVDGQVYEVHEPPELVRQKVHHIEVVVDRVVVREGVRKRLAESVALAVRHGDGLVLASWERGRKSGHWEDRLFSTELSCPDCKISYEELEPRTFSFNSPYGACPRCEGLGALEGFDPELLVPDWSASLAGGAVRPWADPTPAAEKKVRAALAAFLARHRLRWNTPLEKLDEAGRREFFHGSGSPGGSRRTRGTSRQAISSETANPAARATGSPRGNRSRNSKNDPKGFLGILTLLEKEYVTTTSEKKRQRLEAFRGQVVCPECGGSRLREVARTVRVGGRAIHELTALNVGAAQQFVEDLSFPDVSQPIARPLIGEITARLAFLQKVGVAYLTLDRPAATLSGGEIQRVRLASGLGSGLVGVCYVLDEPSIGLHPRDNDRLIGALRDLQQRGNTVVVVEHDEAIMRRADWLLDLGPGAGEHGGQIVAQGPPGKLARANGSLTGRYLAGVEAIPVPPRRRRTAKSRSITIEGVATNNLRGVTVRFPLSALVCLTGVSGSGKSSLLNETLARALARRLGGIAPKPGPYTSLRGVSGIDKVIEIDQSPIG